MAWSNEGIVEVGGRRLAYVEAGPASAHRGAPPPVVCIHGAGGGRESWLLLLRDLARRGVRGVALELPGHGGSPGPGCADVEEYARLVSAFVEGLTSPVLAGHSMGGAIALTCALRVPEKLRGLVLIGTGARLRVLDVLLEETLSDFASAVERFVGYAYSPAAPPALAEEGRRQLLACPPEVMHGDLLACNGFDLMEGIGRIPLPALVVCGEDDSLTPPKYSRYLADRIPGARLRLIEGAGHMVAIERTALVGEAVADFLQGL